MVKLFIYEGYKLTLNTPEILLIREFKAVWDNDPDKEKRGAFEMFKYIYLMEDFRSPYSDFEQGERDKQAKADCSLLDKSEFNDKRLKAALQKYVEIRDSNLLLKFIRSIRGSILRYFEYFDNVNFNEKITEGANKGKLLHSVGDYRKAVEEAEKMIESIKNLEKAVIKEMKEDSTETRGDMFLGHDN